MFIKTLTVSALNSYIKKTMDADFILNNLNIKGEISNFKAHSSGHLYFSLKDENSKINCIMFRGNAALLSFTPKNGECVIVKGRVSVYEKDGSYQLYCNEMIQEGIGELFIKYNELKNKLEKSGLFSAEHKKSLPKYPRRIGVVTSPTGAAVRDIINVTRRRSPLAELIIYPSLVQGQTASEDIIKGIAYFNKLQDVDVIILARGGGSIEELWAFNDERLAYAIYNSEKPIVSGIGHETDFTIADFVSDIRAATPSAAAELTVLSSNEIKIIIESNKSRITSSINSSLTEVRNTINSCNRKLEFYNPLNYIINQYDKIERLREKICNFMNYKLKNNMDQLSRLNAILNAHNPLKVLNKGYSIIEDEDGKLICETEVLREKGKVNIILKDGTSLVNIEYLNNK